MCKRKVIPGDTDDSDTDTDSEDDSDSAGETTPLLTTQNAATFVRTRPNLSGKFFLANYIICVVGPIKPGLTHVSQDHSSGILCLHNEYN